jgi:hypothetical protein
MKVICSYCRKDMGEKEPLDKKLITHGMCPECIEEYDRRWSGVPLEDYLDQFSVPVTAIDDDRRLIAVNQAMADFLGKSKRELCGLLAGEALECAHSKLPGGCGRTVHCRSCTIRNSVTITMTTGESVISSPAHLDQHEGGLDFFISTYMEEGFVRLVVEDAGT